jgi:hypothetical protein
VGILSPTHLIIVATIALVYVTLPIAMFKLGRRVGYSAPISLGLALTGIIPLAAAIALLVLVYQTWPSERVQTAVCSDKPDTPSPN